MSTTPTASNPGGAWYDPLAALALKGLDAYTKVQEVKAGTKPNNVTVLRPEEVNPSTGNVAGVTPTGSAGVKTSALPAWVVPLSIGGGVLLLALALLRRR